uniref:NADH:quinone oxidoreductase/Mrp antiporter transmembrane domain-containing protein n=1 Tax=Brassica campestris TaxID=3711 RepID=A0A3P6DA94_BRACM|nr:unnamed protein product [Brassica rapa]
MWAPDIYEGSPTPVTAFLSIAPKISISANFYVFLFMVPMELHCNKSSFFLQHCFYDLRSTGRHGPNESQKTSSS